MGAYDRGAEIPIITRGDGCYVWDEHGNRYLDALSSLFCVNIGHGRADIAQAGADQARELGFFTNWSYAHPRAIELAAQDRLADAGRPEPRLLHVRRRRVGRDRAQGRAASTTSSPATRTRRRSSRARSPTTARRSARSARPASRRCARRSSRSRRAAATSPNTNLYRLAPGYGVENLAEAIAERIEFEGPETVAAVILEPVQNAGGCFTPPEGYFQRVREICDEHDVLLISDEVICSWGRLGHWFGAERYGYQPDIITTAKGLTSVVRADGGDDRLRPRRRAVPRGHELVHPRLHVRRPPDRLGRRAGEHRGLRGGGRARERARERGRLRAMLETLRDIPIVGDVRGAGYFHAIELVKDQDTKEHFTHEEAEDAAARLPQRRALQARPDLPRRRPRRPGDPVRAAADRGPGAVRGDRLDPAAGARGGVAERASPRSDGCSPSATSIGDLDIRVVAGEASLDAPVRWVHISELPTRRPGCRAASCC